jgi:methylmalonyl-CoA mutase cobalamin-binding subunit
MADEQFTSTRVTDTFIRLDDAPTWVRVSAVEALVATAEGSTQVVLACGDSVYTATLVEDIIELMRAASKPPTRTWPGAP